MTTPSSPNSISADDIRTEFGASGPNNSVKLGNYRISQTVSGLSALPLDTNIPQSVAVGNSAINFGSFRGKKLNIVVDCTPASGTIATRINAKSRYDNNTSITYIGNFASKPASTAGKKVWIHTNGTIGSDKKSTRTYCSLLTGSWDTATDLIIDIGTSGAVYGAGGDGGKGGDTSTTSVGQGVDGSNGTSALGVTVTNSVIISNKGAIVAGGGGGGGGGGGCGYTEGGRKHGNQFSVSGGSGGGGGRGYPGGTGGSGGSASAHSRWSGYPGNKGGDGTTATYGDGGAANGGGNSSGEGVSSGGAGGNGGNITTAAKGGGSGSGSGAQASLGAGGGGKGANGYAIVISNNKTGVTINGNALVGEEKLDTTPV
jgi:hypothetical protein